MGVRADLAAAITAAVQPGHPRVQVYAHPEDVTQVPAIVLVPDDPWAEVGTFGGAGAGTLRWSFNVSMLAPRADVESAIELFEALRILIMEGIGNLGGRFKTMGKPDTLVMAGIEVMAATIEIDILTERQN